MPIYLLHWSFSRYNKLKYILPSEYYEDPEDNNGLSSSSGYISQLGYDSLYPWCQLPSKIKDTSNYYSDCYIQAAASDGNETNEICIIMSGGCWIVGINAGLYFCNIEYNSDYSTNYNYNSVFFEKPGK